MSAQAKISSAKSRSPRTVALIGPYGSGKTLLLESIAAITGVVPRKGSVAAGTSLGDTSAESRARTINGIDRGGIAAHH